MILKVCWMGFQLKAAQRDDDKIVAIMKILEKEPNQDYIMHNKLLCKYISERTNTKFN